MNTPAAQLTDAEKEIWNLQQVIVINFYNKPNSNP